jgi:hypothetical protein
LFVLRILLKTVKSIKRNRGPPNGITVLYNRG